MELRDLFKRNKTKDATDGRMQPAWPPVSVGGPARCESDAPTEIRPSPLETLPNDSTQQDTSPVGTRPDPGVLHWIPAGGSFIVDGRRIEGGMVYVGSKCPSIDGGDTEPGLIDPTLRVAWESPDYGGTTVGYWPSYDAIDPRARAGYLAWLADGRKYPDVHIGYVFLFFYGLERRILFELATDVHGEESTALVAEIRRLLTIYGDNGSFRSYASNLVEFLDAARVSRTELEPPVWDPTFCDWRLPTSLQIGLALFADAGQPLPAEWALSYLRHHPESRLRTPAQRCVAEFDELFKIRYHQRFGEGLKIRPPSTRLRFKYRPASGGITSGVEASIGDLRDVTTITGPINKLAGLGAQVTDELDAYSRFLGRRPDETGSAAAVALLPDELLTTHGGDVVGTLRGWVNTKLAGRSQAVIDATDLIAQWSPDLATRFAKADAVALATMLAKIGIGIEPDVRFGGNTPKPGSPTVLFQLPSGKPAAPSAAYTAVLSLVHLTAIVAAADGSITRAEQEHLAGHAEHVLGLDTGERARLEAHLRYLSEGRLTIASAKRKIEMLPADQRATVGRFLVDVAAADGVVSPTEITTLTKVFAQLGLDEASVYSQVHALGDDDTGPVTVQEAGHPQRFVVPVPGSTSPTANTAGVLLDPAKVQARLAETAHVAALLTDIFSDEAPGVTAPSAPSGPAAALPPPVGPETSLKPPVTPAEAVPAPDEINGSETVAGLDPAHSLLIRRLAQRDSWRRSEAEDAAVQVGLPFLDAALDRINDAAFELCGEPFFEGDDTIDVNVFALEEMLR